MISNYSVKDQKYIEKSESESEVWKVENEFNGNK